jgi:predicted nucleic acid-binding protein
MALVERRANVHAGILMSMYTDILHKAFERRPKAVGPPVVSDAVKEVLDRRSRLAVTRSPKRAAGWAANALANQVAYDVALIELAQSVGLACDPSTFDQPELRRNEVDRELAARGVHLGARN